MTDDTRQALLPGSRAKRMGADSAHQVDFSKIKSLTRCSSHQTRHAPHLRDRVELSTEASPTQPRCRSTPPTFRRLPKSGTSFQWLDGRRAAPGSSKTPLAMLRAHRARPASRHNRRSVPSRKGPTCCPCAVPRSGERVDTTPQSGRDPRSSQRHSKV